MKGIKKKVSLVLQQVSLLEPSAQTLTQYSADIITILINFMQPPFHIHKRFCTGYIVDNNDPMCSSVIPMEQEKTINVNSSSFSFT